MSKKKQKPKPTPISSSGKPEMSTTLGRNDRAVRTMIIIAYAAIAAAILFLVIG